MTITENGRFSVSRAIYMLRNAKAFIDSHPVKDYYVYYDDAECDGYCLSEDLGIAADDLEDAMVKI